MAALNKWAVLDHPALRFQPHNGQLEVMENTARHKVVCAGRRFGKSYIGGHELMPEALYTRSIANELIEKGIRREFWCVGPTYATAEKRVPCLLEFVPSFRNSNGRARVVQQYRFWTDESLAMEWNVYIPS